ncbi:MAG: DUF4125 family protein, partial [Lachnospiraceae bacterium]|nr:DUF4125 family protein [Lachnospiraceae bacterium]
DYVNALNVMEKSRECVAKYLGTDNIQYQRLSENIDIINNKINEIASGENITAEVEIQVIAQEVDLTEVDAQATDIVQTDTISEPVTETNLLEMNIIETNLSETDLKKTDLSEVDVVAPDLSKADNIVTDTAETDIVDINTIERTQQTAQEINEEINQPETNQIGINPTEGESATSDVTEADEISETETSSETIEEYDEAELAPEITGLELCRCYYEEFGRPMIAEKFHAYESFIAVGLVGKGSDCFGFDDILSRDHDFGPRFVMWVTKEVYDQIGEELQEAYDKLPKSYMGVDRIETFHGKDRSGVMVIEDFYKNVIGYDLVGMLVRNHAGSASGKENLNTIKSWLVANDYALAAAVNGEVFRDDEGIFTQYRNMLLAYYPKAVWYRKIAQTCALFSQSGQYNLPRLRRRRQLVAAELAKAECAKQAIKLYYLLNKKYAPHDKWLFKGMPQNPQMTINEEGMENMSVPALVERVSLLPVDRAHETALTTAIESLAVIFANELEKQNIVGKCDLYLDSCTKELTAKSDALLTAVVANTPIITALSLSIAKAEFEAFDKVQNEGGRADCQNNWPTFKVMRMSQYMTWTEDMLLQYLYEFKANYENGRNMIEEKYARMMESTAPLEYARFADQLPPVSDEKKAVIEQIVSLQVKWMEEFAAAYPNLADDARSIHSAEDLPYDTSYETYLRGELGTYSDRMLEMYGRYIVEHAQEGKNVAREIMENTVHFYGYKDLEAANAK